MNKTLRNMTRKKKTVNRKRKGGVKKIPTEPKKPTKQSTRVTQQPDRLTYDHPVPVRRKTIKKQPSNKTVPKRHGWWLNATYRRQMRDKNRPTKEQINKIIKTFHELPPRPAKTLDQVIDSAFYFHKSALPIRSVLNPEYVYEIYTKEQGFKPEDLTEQYKEFMVNYIRSRLEALNSGIISHTDSRNLSKLSSVEEDELYADL